MATNPDSVPKLDACQALLRAEAAAWPHPLPLPEACALLDPLLRLNRADLCWRVIRASTFLPAETNLLSARLYLNRGDWSKAAGYLRNTPRGAESRIPAFAPLDREAFFLRLLEECESLLGFAPAEEIAAAAQLLALDAPRSVRVRKLAIRAHVLAGYDTAALEAAQDISPKAGFDVDVRQKLLQLCLTESQSEGRDLLADRAAMALVELTGDDRRQVLQLVTKSDEERNAPMVRALAASSQLTAPEQVHLKIRAAVLEGDLADALNALKTLPPDGAGFFHPNRLIKWLFDEAETAFDRGDITTAAQLTQGLLKNNPRHFRIRALLIMALARKSSPDDIEPWLENLADDSGDDKPDILRERLLRYAFREALAARRWETARWTVGELLHDEKEAHRETWKLLNALLRADEACDLATDPLLVQLGTAHRHLLLLRHAIARGEIGLIVEACARFLGQTEQSANDSGESEKPPLETALQLLISGEALPAGLAQALALHPAAEDGPVRDLAAISLALEGNTALLLQPSSPPALLRLAFDFALKLNLAGPAAALYPALHEHGLDAGDDLVRLRLAQDRAVEADSLLPAESPLRLQTAIGAREPIAALVRAISQLHREPADLIAFGAAESALRELGFEEASGALPVPTEDATEAEVCIWARAQAAVDLAEAVSTWEQARDLHPSSLRIASALALALVDDLRHDDALNLVEECIEANPTSFIAYRLRTQYYQATGEWTRWRQVAEQNLARFPGNALLAFDLARCLIELGHASEADAILDKVELSREDQTAIVRVKARQHFLERRLPEAIALLRGICASRNATHADEHLLAIWLFADGQFEQALHHLQIQTHRFPGVARFPEKVAQSLERLDRPAEALAAWQTAHFRQPTNNSSLVGVARSLAYLGRREEFQSWMKFFPTTGLGTVQAGFLNAWEAWRNKEEAASLEAFHLARNLLFRHTRILESAFEEDPALVHHHGAWVKHPDALYAKSNRHFWELVRRIRGGNVIIIGNSPCLLKSGLGATIDKYDVVIRLNDFLTEGFTVDVGSKIDLWYSSANRFAQLKARNLEEFDILLRQPSAHSFPETAPFCQTRLGLSLTASNRVSYIPSPFYDLMTEVLYPNPTSGLIMILLLLGVVREPIHLAGFDFFLENSHHYFEGEKERLPVGVVHAARFENEFVLGLLQERGAVKLLGTTAK